MFSIAHLKNLGDIIGGWALPVKFLASSVIGALAGAGLLSFFVEYATHSFALAYGFRPPVEGIPYLQATVTGASVALLISGALLAAGLIFLLQQGVKRPSSKAGTVVDGDGLSSNRAVKAVQLLLGAAVSLFALGYPLVWVACKFSLSLSCTHFWTNESTAIASTILGMITSALVTWRPGLVWWFSIGSVATYYIAFLVLLFTPPQYAAFLRYTGFGGGLPVELEIEAKQDAPNTTISTHLVLRTSRALVVFSKADNTFHEYPQERVARLSYKAGGLYMQGHLLPPLSGSGE